MSRRRPAAGSPAAAVASDKASAGAASAAPVLRLVVEDHVLPGGSYPLAAAGFLAEHLEWMQLQGRAERTLRARREAVVRLAEFLGCDPLGASYEQLYGWQRHLRRTSLDWVRHQTAMVRPYYRWLQAAGHRDDNPAVLLVAPRPRRRVPRPISEERLRHAVELAPARVLPWLLLAGWSGLRAAEVAAVRVEDFFASADERRWVRVQGKGGHVRHAPIPGWAWPRIEVALAATGPAWGTVRGGRPLSAHHVSSYANSYLRSVGIPDTFHALRHRVATMVYAQTSDIRLVQELLGHTSPATTAIYTQVAPAKTAVAVDALPPP